MKRQTKRLRLSRQTIRTLTSAALSGAVGGQIDTWTNDDTKTHVTCPTHQFPSCQPFPDPPPDA